MSKICLVKTIGLSVAASALGTLVSVGFFFLLGYERATSLGPFVPFIIGCVVTLLFLFPWVLTTHNLRQKQEALTHLASTDPLTGLPNRRTFFEDVKFVINDQSIDKFAAIYLLDLDRFKKINDTYGHAVGDDALRRVATILAQTMETLGPSVAIGRLGGEEFVVGCLVDSEASARNIAEDLCAGIRSIDFRIDSRQVVLRTSVGVAICRAPVSVEHVISLADEAAYKAKREGGDRWCLVSVGEARLNFVPELVPPSERYA